jgi:predicted RNA binding protein YcfA (HicA-like mRNA interferase family)
MSNESRLVHLLRNVSARDLERAILRDGFIFYREPRTGGRFYKHPDGRRTNIHYHHARDTFTRKTLANILTATRWTEDDARRLGLL